MTPTAIRVLLPVDGSPSALRAVSHVIERKVAGEDLEPALLNVQPPVLAPNLTNLLDETMVEDYYRNQSDAVLRPAKALLTEAGMSFAEFTRVGNVAESIVEVMQQERCDEIVMGTRGRGALGRLVLGSVADKVLRMSEVPVTLVR